MSDMQHMIEEVIVPKTTRSGPKQKARTLFSSTRDVHAVRHSSILKAQKALFSLSPTGLNVKSLIKGDRGQEGSQQLHLRAAPTTSRFTARTHAGVRTAQ